MKKIGIICKHNRPEPLEILSELAPWLKERGIEVLVDASGSCSNLSDARVLSFEEMLSEADMVMVLGGDGTTLGAARVACCTDVPLLGVNLGGMGFITEVGVSELYQVLEGVLKGEYTLEQRIMLNAKVMRDGAELSKYKALNDIVINKGALATLIDIDISVNNTSVTSYKADGIVVSTPTGSTAYSMSAGGPILYPTLSCMTLTPICPHMLTNRPIVVPDDVTVEVTLRSNTGDVIINYDGIVGESLLKDDTVIISKAPDVTTFVMPRGRSHFQTLKNKLKWGQR